jgi:hypothetical protein
MKTETKKETRNEGAKQGGAKRKVNRDEEE